MPIWEWSTNPASNAGADPTINWAEGQSGSSVNDSARAMMARIAEWRLDISGNILDTGTATAYAVTTNEGLPSTPNDGTVVSFTPANTNGTGVTLAADLGTAFAIQSSPGNAIATGVMIAGTPYDLVFHAATPCWLLKNSQGTNVGSIVVPVGGLLAYTGASAPSSNFALVFGQAISRTGFATLFALIGTTFGVGDGVTTFNIPDLRGRGMHGLDNMGGSSANRITGGTTMGGAFGSQSITLLQSQLPNVNFPVTDPQHIHTLTGSAPSGLAKFTGGDVGAPGPGSVASTPPSPGITQTDLASTGISVNSGGSGGAITVLNPLLVLNIIMRIL